MITSRVVRTDWKMSYDCCILLESFIIQEVDAGAVFTINSISLQHLDFTNTKRMYINHSSSCSQTVLIRPDTNALLLKWINVFNNMIIFSCAASNMCMAVLKWEASHLQPGVLHAVNCEDDGSDSTHYYLMIYCNSLTISICFAIRSLFPSSLLFRPTVYFLPSLYHSHKGAV